MNRVAKTVVTLLRTSAAEEARATPWIPPPKAPLMPPPLPDCKSTTKIKKRHTMMCRILMNPMVFLYKSNM